MVAPTGVQFSGALAVDIVGAADPGTNIETLTGITVAPATVEESVVTTSDTIEGAIAALITGFTEIQDVTALVRAASVGGLE